MQAIDVGDGVRMVPVTVELADELQAVVEANRAHLAAWLPWARDQRHEDGRAFLEKSVKSMAAGRELVFGIFVDDRLAGLIDLRDIDRVAGHAAIGYWLALAHTRKGIVTRCVARLLGLGFADLGLHRVELRAAPGNGRSRAVPERLGFTLEGTAREVVPFHDRWLDLCVYSMLAHEWEAKRALPGAPTAPGTR
jgi:ribosomal-protein-serine acetyltransferase